jgi:hypothetical protein
MNSRLGFSSVHKHSRFGAFQTLLPQCGLPGKYRLKGPEHWHDGILATTTRSRSLGHYFLLADNSGVTAGIQT